MVIKRLTRSKTDGPWITVHFHPGHDSLDLTPHRKYDHLNPSDHMRPYLTSFDPTNLEYADSIRWVNIIPINFDIIFNFLNKLFLPSFTSCFSKYFVI